MFRCTCDGSKNTTHAWKHDTIGVGVECWHTISYLYDCPVAHKIEQKKTSLSVLSVRTYVE